MRSSTIKRVKEIEERSTILFNENEISSAIDKISVKMNKELKGKSPLFLCVMSGALIFTGHLITKLSFYLEIDYIHVSRYRGEIHAKELHWFAEPSVSIKGRNIVVIDDILDSGLTLAGIKDYCIQKGAKSILTAVLIDKKCNREKGGVEKADFFGTKAPNKFLVGYGLDYKGFLRNLPNIYSVNE